MNEAILKFAWKHRFYQQTDLKTTDGRRLSVLKPGRENFDAGPDFFMADLRIEDTRWVGNVEIHVRSSDWFRHGHETDNAYNNVTLHVVYEHDKEISIHGQNLPTFELKDNISKQLLSGYDDVLSGKFKVIPCEKNLASIDPLQVNTWVSRLLIERLDQRVLQLEELLKANRGDLNETYYQWLCLGFGRRVNKEAFLQLSRVCPYSLLRKYQTDKLALDALLFGQSGLLPAHPDLDYVNDLIKRYRFLAHKHGLKPMKKESWKLMRMRPSNFPTIRLAQLSALLLRYPMEKLYRSELSQEFDVSVELNAYWDEHYSFNSTGRATMKDLGADFKRHLKLNVQAPFRVIYLKLQGREWANEVEDLFQTVPPERNKILRGMEKIGFENSCGAQSQGLLQLYNMYCEQKKCLLCNIGYQILRG